MGLDTLGGGLAGGGAVGGVSTGGNTAGDTGTVGSQIVYVGGANITLSEATAAGGLATVTIIGGAGGAGFQGGVSNLGNTSGATKTVANMNVFAGGNNITLSQATNAGGATITISAFTQTVQTQNMVAISATDTLYSSGTVRLTGSNMITVKSSGAGQTVIFDATQTLQTSNVHNVTLAGNSTSAGAGYIQVSSGTLTLAGGANITLSQNGNAVSILGAGGGAFSGGVSSGGNTAGDTKTVGSQIVFVGGNNVTLSQGTNGNSATITISGPSGGGAGASNLGNTAGTTGTVGIELAIVGSNNITLSQSINGSSGTLSIIGAAGGAFTGGVSTGGNTGGTTGTVNNGILFFGGTNITLQQSSAAGGATISVLGADQRFSAGVSTDGNTAGSTGTVSNRLVLVGGTNVTLSQSTDASANATVSIIAGGGADITFSHFPLGLWPAGTTGVQMINATTSVNGASTHTTISYMVQPLDVHENFVATRLWLLGALSTGVGTGSATIRNYAGIYEISSDSLTRLSSYFGGLLYSQNDTTAVSIAAFTGTASNTFASFGGNSSATMAGMKLLRMHDGAATTFTKGNYFFVYGGQLDSSGASVREYLMVQPNNALYEAARNTDNANSAWYGLGGFVSSTSSVTSADSNQWLMPPSFPTSNIVTSTNAANRPLFYFRS